MPSYSTRSFWLLYLLAAVVTCGCGGGGESISVGNSGSRQGSLSLQVVFPQPLRSVGPEKASRTLDGRYLPGDIPDGSYSIKIVLTNPTTGMAVSPPRIVTAPLASSGSLATPITINFAALPLGPIQVDVTAHPDTQATETPLAIGSGTATIVPLGNTIVHIPLTLTADELTIVSKIHVSQGKPGSLTARILDKQGNLLKTPLLFSSADTTIATVPATGLSGVAVAVTAGSQTGQVQIEVLEPDSGLHTFVTFLVQ
ncbi:MAG TPA: hypothetical protein VKU00_21830 [Chthonomonadaceae bacterium]|nr:hypothetical protein [Chthonomonadaceae bacterium]